MKEGALMAEQGDSRPVPDPTLLTTQALQREIASLRELIEARFDAERTLTAIRFEAVERNRVEQKHDTALSLDAALTTAKEAVGLQTQASERATAKTEASFTKQLEQQSETQRVATAGLSKSLDDLRERVAHIETLKEGAGKAYAGIVAAVLFLSLVVGIAATVIAFAS